MDIIVSLESLEKVFWYVIIPLIIVLVFFYYALEFSFSITFFSFLLNSIRGININLPQPVHFNFISAPSLTISQLFVPQGCPFFIIT